MRVDSRELFVGFLLVLALGTSGCQPIQPVTDVSAAAGGESNVASAAITETATITESVVASSTATTAEATSAVTETVSVKNISESTATEASSVAETADPALVEAGLGVYRAQYCGVCHTSDAAETRGMFGPPHNGMATIAVTRLADPAYSGTATTPADYIHESIVDPQVYTVPGFAATSHRMPVYAHLDAVSLEALVAFLLAN